MKVKVNGIFIHLPCNCQRENIRRKHEMLLSKTTSLFSVCDMYFCAWKSLYGRTRNVAAAGYYDREGVPWTFLLGVPCMQLYETQNGQ